MVRSYGNTKCVNKDAMLNLIGRKELWMIKS